MDGFTPLLKPAEGPPLVPQSLIFPRAQVKSDTISALLGDKQVSKPLEGTPGWRTGGLITPSWRARASRGAQHSPSQVYAFPTQDRSPNCPPARPMKETWETPPQGGGEAFCATRVRDCVCHGQRKYQSFYVDLRNDKGRWFRGAFKRQVVQTSSLSLTTGPACLKPPCLLGKMHPWLSSEDLRMKRAKANSICLGNSYL